MKLGVQKRKKELIVDGKVPSEKSLKIEAFTKALESTILQNINPKSYILNIETKLTVGD